jgi:hypothetical protein
MDYTFSKGIIKNPEASEAKYRAHTKVYTLYDKDNPVGTLIHGPDNRSIRFDNQIYDIEDRSFLAKKIIDTDTMLDIGEFRLPLLSGLFGYSNKLALTGAEPLVFKKLSAVNLFKKDTWHNYEVELANDRDAIAYTFKMDLPFFRTTPKPMYLFNGTVTSSTQHKLSILAGFFFIERMLENEEEASNS